MRIIAHIDLDAFFAAIEERDTPRLRGRPVVVGADPLEGKGRGVVSTANYAARKYGIRSAMPISKAWRLSEEARRRGEPAAVFLGVDMEKYAEESQRVREILARHAETIEVASVDEAYLDLSSMGTYPRAREAARKIKDDIRKREGLTASVGVGPNKLVAKIASDAEKPDGLTVVAPEDAEKFLEPLPLRVIPGVGPKTDERFLKLGVRTVGDARRFTREELGDLLGKWGADLYEKLRGRDDAPLTTEWVPKSVGEQETFAHDVPIDSARDRKTLTDALAALAADVHRRFAQEAHAGHFNSFRAIAITVRFADFTTKSRTVTLDAPAAAGSPAALRTLRFQTLRLFMPFMDRRENPRRRAIRLLGVRVERLA